MEGECGRIVWEDSVGGEGGRRGWEERVGGEGGRRGWEERVGGEGGRRGWEERVGGEGGRKEWLCKGHQSMITICISNTEVRQIKHIDNTLIGSTSNC